MIDSTTRGAGRTFETTGVGAPGQGTTRRRRDGGPRATSVRGLVDLAALVVLLGAVAAGFAPVWGTPGYLLPAVGGAVVGLAVAWVGAWRRFPAVLVVAAALVAYLVLGAALAVPHAAVAGFLPGLSSTRLLLVGAVQSWKQFVTTVPPISSFPDLAVVPYLLMLVVALVAGTVAWRAKHAAWALAPVAVGLVAVILLGTLEDAWPVWQGLVIAVVGLLWGGARAVEARVGTHSIATESGQDAARRLRWHHARTGLGIVAVAAVTAGLAAPAIMPEQPRTVLREIVVPPLDLYEFASPLASFRQYAKELRDEELFTVTGLPAGERVRLAALDQYDGVVYGASGSGGDAGVYIRVGEDILTAAQGTPHEIEVAVSRYSGPWAPAAGSLTGVSWEGGDAAALGASTYYNSTTQSLLTTAGLAPGTTYRLTTLLADVPDEDDLRAGEILESDLPGVPRGAVPPGLPTKAVQFTGEEIDPATKLFMLRDALASSGVLSSGLDGQVPSRPGHSAERIDTLVQADEMIGDDEQFAVALALMAQQAGIPARVVMGFYPDADSEQNDGESWTVHGRDVRAWVEVPFEGHGWVPIEAVPEEKPQIQPEPQSEEVPKPPILQDPEPPEDPGTERAGSVEDSDESEEAEADGFDWALLGFIVMVVGIPLILILAPIIAILAYKARRRAARRLAEDPVDRFSGGWYEVLDVATDLGTTVPASATRRESAYLIAEEFRAPGTLTLAHRVDSTVFGSTGSDPQQAEAFWREVDELVGGVRSGVGRRRRARAALSLRSIRAHQRRSRTQRRPTKGSR